MTDLGFRQLIAEYALGESPKPLHLLLQFLPSGNLVEWQLVHGPQEFRYQLFFADIRFTAINGAGLRAVVVDVATGGAGRPPERWASFAFLANQE